MTFNEWWDKTSIIFCGHSRLSDKEIAEAAWKAVCDQIKEESKVNYVLGTKKTLKDLHRRVSYDI